MENKIKSRIKWKLILNITYTTHRTTNNIKLKQIKINYFTLLNYVCDIFLECRIINYIKILNYIF